MDEDGSQSISKDEAISYWEKNFAKVNAEAFFKTVDFDKSGTISFDEWIDFWRVVKGHGHSEEEIMEEVSYLHLS